LLSFEDNVIIIEKIRHQSYLYYLMGDALVIRRNFNHIYWVGRPRFEKSNNVLTFKFIVDNMNFFDEEFIFRLRNNRYMMPEQFLQKLNSASIIEKDNISDINKSFDNINKNNDIMSILEENSEFKQILFNFTTSYDNLKDLDDKGLKIRNLFFDCLSQLLEIEVKFFKHDKNYNPIFFKVTGSKCTFNWLSIDVVFQYFIKNSVGMNMSEIEIYNIINPKSVSDINICKKSFKKRIRENSVIKNIRDRMIP
jgi:hypothetical protein